MIERLRPGTRVTHSRTGWVGTVIAHLPGASGGSYHVRWDRNDQDDRRVAPRYIEPGGDISPTGDDLSQHKG